MCITPNSLIFNLTTNWKPLAPDIPKLKGNEMGVPDVPEVPVTFPIVLRIFLEKSKRVPGLKELFVNAFFFFVTVYYAVSKRNIFTH